MKVTSIRASIQHGLKNILTLSTACQRTLLSVSFALCLVIVLARKRQTTHGSKKAFDLGTSLKVVVQRSKENSPSIFRPRPTIVHSFPMLTSPKPPDTLMSCWIKQGVPPSFKKKKIFSKNRRVIEILLDITKTLGRQGIAFRGHGSDDDGNLAPFLNNQGFQTQAQDYITR